jgi:homospermidine synthase
VKIDPTSITVVDFLDNRDRIADLIAQGVQYEIGRVTPENLDEFLSARLSDGDMLLDLAWSPNGRALDGRLRCLLLTQFLRETYRSAFPDLA